MAKDKCTDTTKKEQLLESLPKDSMSVMKNFPINISMAHILSYGSEACFSGCFSFHTHSDTSVSCCFIPFFYKHCYLIRTKHIMLYKYKVQRADMTMSKTKNAPILNKQVRKKGKENGPNQIWEQILNKTQQL